MKKEPKLTLRIRDIITLMKGQDPELIHQRILEEIEKETIKNTEKYKKLRKNDERRNDE